MPLLFGDDQEGIVGKPLKEEKKSSEALQMEDPPDGDNSSLQTGRCGLGPDAACLTP